MGTSSNFCYFLLKGYRRSESCSKMALSFRPSLKESKATSVFIVHLLLLTVSKHESSWFHQQPEIKHQHKPNGKGGGCFCSSGLHSSSYVMQSRRISELVILGQRKVLGSLDQRDKTVTFEVKILILSILRKKVFFKIKEVSPCQYKNHHIGLIPLVSEDSKSERAHKGQYVKVWLVLRYYRPPKSSGFSPRLFSISLMRCITKNWQLQIWNYDCCLYVFHVYGNCPRKSSFMICSGIL